MRTSLKLHGAAGILLAGMAAMSAASAEPARRHVDSAKGKFIPTYAIIYGKAEGRRTAEETAKFDLLICSSNASYSNMWAADGRNSWHTLKKLNPNIVILVYGIGPGEYNTASWGQLGEGWEWLKNNHGNEAEDRWTARGIQYGTYLQQKTYPNERLMEIANRNWQDYWREAIYQDYWGGRKKIDLDGVDGLFADNVSYSLVWRGTWHREGFPGQPDEPERYFADGKYQHDLWREAMNGALERAIPWFAERNVSFAINFANRDEKEEWWTELDSQPAPPFAAMDEVGFICPYGSGPSWFIIRDWERRVRQLQSMRNLRVLMNGHANVPSGQGLEKMDVPDPTGMTGWDALWFSMTSFLLGYDDVARNGYMNFTLWSYTGYYWMDEFDPQYLHLGKARGAYYRLGELYVREFEDGFVVVNPGTQDAADVEAPAANVRILNHGNFRSAEEIEPVSRFDLPAHRGIVLLKEGRKAGNGDNPES